MRARTVVVGALHAVVAGAGSTVVVGASPQVRDSTAEVEDLMITSYPLRVHSWPARSHDRSSVRPATGRWPGSQSQAGSSPRWCRAHETGRNLVCRLLLEKKKTMRNSIKRQSEHIDRDNMENTTNKKPR